MRSAPPRHPNVPRSVVSPPDASFPALIGSGNPEAHDYAAGLPDAAPSAASYPAEVDRIIDYFPLDRTRCFGLLRQNCPALGALRLAAESVAAGDYIEAHAVLARYYAEVPASAAQVLGLPDDHEMGDYPPLAAVLPWVVAEPGVHLVAREADIRAYCAQNSLVGWGMADGHAVFGPVSRRMLRHQVVRLANALLGAMRTRGIVDDSLVGTVVEDDRTGDCIFDVRGGGLYRCAAYAVLGHDSARVRAVGPAVRRSDVHYWHHVQTGMFTADEALGIFDRYLEGVL